MKCQYQNASHNSVRSWLKCVTGIVFPVSSHLLSDFGPVLRCIFSCFFYCITTNGAGTGYPSGASEFISIFMRFVFLIFCVVFCRSLFVPLLSFFLLHIELSALRITSFDYPFGILKLFSILCRKHIKGILKLILVICCMSWKLAIGSINDIYETLTQFLSMKLCKSDIIHW